MLSPNRNVPQQNEIMSSPVKMTNVEKEAELLGKRNESFIIIPPKEAQLQPFSDIQPQQNTFFETSVPTFDQQAHIPTLVQPPVELPSFSTINAQPNETFSPKQTDEQKSYSDDIMNMDIIFEDIPIDAQQTDQNIHLHNLTPINDLTEASVAGNDLILHSTQTTPIRSNDFVLSTNDIMIITPQDNVIENILPTAVVTQESSWPIQSQVSDALVEHLNTESNANVLQQTKLENTDIVLDVLHSNENQEGKSIVEIKTLNEVMIKPETRILETNDPQPQTEDMKIKSPPSASKPSEPPKHRRRPAPILVDRNRKSVTKAVKTEKNDQKAKPVEPPKIEKQEETPAKKEDSISQNIDCTSDTAAQESETKTAKISEDNSNTNFPDDNFLYSLVVVESQDETDKNKTVCKVYYVCPETKKMSNQPLDLPDEVVQRIRRIRSSENAAS